MGVSDALSGTLFRYTQNGKGWWILSKRSRTAFKLLLAVALISASVLVAVRKRSGSIEEASHPAIAIKSAATASAPATTVSRAPIRSQFDLRPLEEVERIRSEQNAYFEQTLREPKRKTWTLLPSWITSVIFDHFGNAVFGSQAIPNAPPQLRRNSVEEAFAGKVRTVHNADVVLIDSRGQFWLKFPGGVECVDATGWRTYTVGAPSPNPTSGPSSQPESLRVAGVRNSSIRIDPFGFEDSAGNCWFVASKLLLPGFIILQIKPDGSKAEYKMEDERAVSNWMENRTQRGFYEQDGGRLTLALAMAPPGHSSAELSALRIYRFDGSGWKTVEPKFCDHNLQYVVPQKDGSLKLVCDGGRFWTYWPDDFRDSMQAQVNQWFTSLSDPDSAVRAAAYRGLFTIGPQLDALLPVARDNELGPASRVAMERIRTNYAKMAKVDEKRLHSELVTYDIGVEIAAAMPVARTRAGEVVLSVAGMKFSGAETAQPRGLLWLGRDGKSNARAAVAQGYIEPFFGGASSESGWADMNGTIWRSSRSRVNDSYSYLISTRRTAEGGYSHAMPPGGSFDHVFGEDRDGRIYFTMYLESGFRVVMYDPKAAPGRAWPAATITGDALIPTADGRQGWATVYANDGATQLLILSQAGSKAVSPPIKIANQYQLIPLCRNALILEPTKADSDKPSLYFDGTSWTQAPDTATLVRQNIRSMLENAPSQMQGDAKFSRVAVALRTDGSRRGLWFASRYTEKTDQPRFLNATSQPTAHTRSQQAPLDYYDGATWRDVVADLRAANPEYLGIVATTFDRGRSIVIRPARPGASLLASYPEDGAFIARSMDGNIMLDTHYVVDAQGVWSSLRNSLYRFHDGKSDTFEGRSLKPLLGDSRGRAWFFDPANCDLIAWDSGTFREKRLATRELDVRMLEGADGRLWLVQKDAVWLVELLEQSDGTRSIQAERFDWDGPKRELNDPFIDARDGLWIFADARRITRFALPTSPHPATAPSDAGPTTAAAN